MSEVVTEYQRGWEDGFDAAVQGMRMRDEMQQFAPGPGGHDDDDPCLHKSKMLFALQRQYCAADDCACRRYELGQGPFYLAVKGSEKRGYESVIAKAWGSRLDGAEELLSRVLEAGCGNGWIRQDIEKFLASAGSRGDGT